MRASYSTVFDDLHRALYRVCVGTDGNANPLHPTPFCDADVNAVKQGNFFQCRYVPLRRQGHIFTRVHGNTDAGQLSLQERRYVNCVRFDFNHSDDDIVQVGEHFNTHWFELFSRPPQYRHERHAEQRRSHGVPLLNSTGAVDLTPFSRVHLKEHGCRSFAVTFDDERCECRHASGSLREHRRPFDRVDRIGAVREDHPVFRLVVLSGA